MLILKLLRHFVGALILLVIGAGVALVLAALRGQVDSQALTGLVDGFTTFASTGISTWPAWAQVPGIVIGIGIAITLMVVWLLFVRPALMEVKQTIDDLSLRNYRLVEEAADYEQCTDDLSSATKTIQALQKEAAEWREKHNRLLCDKDALTTAEEMPKTLSDLIGLLQDMPEQMKHALAALAAQVEAVDSAKAHLQQTVDQHEERLQESLIQLQQKLTAGVRALNGDAGEQQAILAAESAVGQVITGEAAEDAMIELFSTIKLLQRSRGDGDLDSLEDEMVDLAEGITKAYRGRKLPLPVVVMGLWVIGRCLLECDNVSNEGADLALQCSVLMPALCAV